MANDDLSIHDSTPASSPGPAHDAQPPSPPKKRRGWLRVTLKTLLWILVVILALPWLVYIPPVQTLLKNAACSIIRSSTGMDVSIDRFLLTFPLDVNLRGVSVVEATGDTMISARELIADVKLLPLLKLDVKVNRLDLLDGYYRMVSPDSSMVLKIRAGKLRVDDRSSVDIGRSEILLNKAEMENASVALFMDVWRQKPTPTDTAATPFLIKINDLKAKNLTFAMSMLPVIDTLHLRTGDLSLKDGVIDLRTGDISFSDASLAKGDVKYLVPTQEYIAAHPMPEADTTAVSEPMTIKGGRIALTDFSALYATKGASPVPGFDPMYIQASGINIVLKDFYNRETVVRLPIESVAARERSGLEITSGSGLIAVSEEGLVFDDLRLRTPWSSINGGATIPYALMDLDPQARLDADVEASLGVPDLVAFMPDLNAYLKYTPAGTKLDLRAVAYGSLSDVAIDRLDVSLTNILRLSARGTARNALDFKNLVADVKFDGALTNPRVADRMAGGTGINLPTLTIAGTAGVNRETYTADFDLKTSSGDLAAEGTVSMNAESYRVDADIRNLNVADFVPDLGIGRLSASVQADGAGFNPTLPGARTEAVVDISRLDYGSHTFSGITADAFLRDHDFTLSLLSSDPAADLDIRAEGTVEPNLYDVTLRGFVNNLDLQELGFTPDTNRGSMTIDLAATARPDNWLYNVDLSLGNLDWDMAGSAIHLPEGVHVALDAQADNVRASVESLLTSLTFTSATGLQKIVDDFMAAADLVGRQVEDKNLDISQIQQALPPFDLDLAASGRGLINRLASAQQISLDTVYGRISNSDLFGARIGVRGLKASGIALDTITLNLSQRGNLLDYRAHLGNRPGTLDEFAKVDVNGYLGGNRASLFLNQRNIQGQTGYRLGLTAAMQDSTVSLHFTPLKCTIGYMPWSINAENFVDYNLANSKIEADLQAKSSESSILLRTEPDITGATVLHAILDNIHVEDFLQMYAQAPPVTATVNSDIRIKYLDNSFVGNGTLGLRNLTYERQKVGDLDFEFHADLDLDGDTSAEASLLVNGQKAMTATGTILNSPREGEQKNRFGVELTQFPLTIANAFLPKDMAQLKGVLNGDLSMHGDFTAPVLNGSIAFDGVSVFIPMAGSSLRLDSVPVTVKNNFLDMNSFKIWAQNSNPITIAGTVDARKLTDVRLDLGLNGSNVQLVNNDRRAHSDIYGKIFLNLDASARGPVDMLDVNANLSVLGTTDAYYQVSSAAQAMTQVTNASDVVKFINFSDSTQVAKADSIVSPFNMRVNARVNISQGTQVAVLLSSNGTDRVELTPYGQLTYFQNYMGDMRLNGQLNLGTGFARYNIPVMGEKKFTFEPNSYVLWTGDLMNPQLHINAYDDVRASVVQGQGNSQTIKFKVGVAITNTLSQPGVMFDLSTNENVAIANELQSMSPDQRSNQAMNMLITGQYMGSSGNTKMNFSAEGQLYSFLASTLNSWAANNIRGVDLTFGVDQNEHTVNGQTSNSMSYTYQVSKSLFNNKFKIVVGGNYTTDASADENFSQNLINDISFEYMIRQSNNLSMYVSLFRHTGFESILEGEVTETGVGFVMRRKISNFHQLFRFGRRRRSAVSAAPAEAPADSVPTDTLKNL